MIDVRETISDFYGISATAQWFANVEHLQQKAIESLKQVRMIPEVCKFCKWIIQSKVQPLTAIYK
jgi:hypothetical protein